MSLIKLLWINDEPECNLYLFSQLLNNYDISIYACKTNQEALIKAKDSWDVVFYDIGMDNGHSHYDLPIAKKLREMVSPSPFIGGSMIPLGFGFHKNYNDYFDDCIEFGRFDELEDFVRLAEKYNLKLEQKVE